MEFSNVIAPEDMLQNFGTYPEINPLAIGLSFLLIFRELFFYGVICISFLLISISLHQNSGKKQMKQKTENGNVICLARLMFGPSCFEV